MHVFIIAFGRVVLIKSGMKNEFVFVLLLTILSIAVPYLGYFYLINRVVIIDFFIATGKYLKVNLR